MEKEKITVGEKFLKKLKKDDAIMRAIRIAIQNRFIGGEYCPVFVTSDEPTEKDDDVMRRLTELFGITIQFHIPTEDTFEIDDEAECICEQENEQYISINKDVMKEVYLKITEYTRKDGSFSLEEGIRHKLITSIPIQCLIEWEDEERKLYE